MDELTRKLFEIAVATRENARVPVSGYKVGAAVLGSSGKIYGGCNIETVTFNITSHAEMTAIDTAMAAGEKIIEKILVVIDTERPVRPCALCRQKIAEYSDYSAEIICSNLKGKYEVTDIKHLYPEPFLSIE